MEQFDLFENFQEQYSVSVFNDRQTVVLQGLSKRIPKMALLHKDLKCKAPLIELNLRRNLGKWST